MKLIIVLLVLVLRRLDISWPSWLRENALYKHVVNPDGSAEGAEWLLKVFLPALMIGVAMIWLQQIFWGLPAVALGLLLLLWMLGVDSEFRQLDELIVRARMNDGDHFFQIAQQYFNSGKEPGKPGYYPGLIRAISQRELTLIFSVLFYLITLGYGFALFYLLNFWLSQRKDNANGWATIWHQALIWLPSRLLVLALALGGDFRSVMAAVDGRLWQRGDSGDVFVDALNAARDTDDVEEDAAVAELVDSLEDLQSLLLRVLAIWLIFAALWVVLAG